MIVPVCKIIYIKNLYKPEHPFQLEMTNTNRNILGISYYML